MATKIDDMSARSSPMGCLCGNADCKTLFPSGVGVKASGRIILVVGSYPLQSFWLERHVEDTNSVV